MAASDLKLNMKREDYLLLKNDLHVLKVLFELGLLSVKAIDNRNNILLGAPNDLVTDNALKLLVQEAGYRDPPKKKAEEYMSDAGFGIMMSKAALVSVGWVNRNLSPLFIGSSRTGFRTRLAKTISYTRK